MLSFYPFMANRNLLSGHASYIWISAHKDISGGTWLVSERYTAVAVTKMYLWGGLREIS
jgi:hypothetical protein